MSFARKEAVELFIYLPVSLGIKINHSCEGNWRFCYSSISRRHGCKRGGHWKADYSQRHTHRHTQTPHVLLCELSQTRPSCQNRCELILTYKRIACQSYIKGTSQIIIYCQHHSILNNITYWQYSGDQIFMKGIFVILKIFQVFSVSTDDDDK